MGALVEVALQFPEVVLSSRTMLTCGGRSG
jgi:hypothetical protein